MYLTSHPARVLNCQIQDELFDLQVNLEANDSPLAPVRPFASHQRPMPLQNCVRFEHQNTLAQPLFPTNPALFIRPASDAKNTFSAEPIVQDLANYLHPLGPEPTDRTCAGLGQAPWSKSAGRRGDLRNDGGGTSCWTRSVCNFTARDVEDAKKTVAKSRTLV